MTINIMTLSILVSIMLSVANKPILLSVAMYYAVMLGVVTLNAVMLSTVAPFKIFSRHLAKRHLINCTFG
jgi:hypothetical protein